MANQKEKKIINVLKFFAKNLRENEIAREVSGSKAQKKRIEGERITEALWGKDWR